MRIDGNEIDVVTLIGGENVIFTPHIEEAFFNVFDVSVTADVSFVKEAVAKIDGDPIISVDIVYRDQEYKGVLFRVVTCEDRGIYLNKESLTAGSVFTAAAELEDEHELAEVVSEAAESAVDLSDVRADENPEELREAARISYEQRIVSSLQHVQEQLSSKVTESLDAARESILIEALNSYNRIQQVNDSKLKDTVIAVKSVLEGWSAKTSLQLEAKIAESIGLAEIELSEQNEENLNFSTAARFDELAKSIDRYGIEARASIKEDLVKMLIEQKIELDNTLSTSTKEVQDWAHEVIEEAAEVIETQQVQLFNEKVEELSRKQLEWLTTVVEKKVSALDDLVKDAARKVADRILIESKTIQADQLKTVRDCVQEVLTEQFSSPGGLPSLIEEKSNNIIKNTLLTYKNQMAADLKVQLSTLQNDMHRKFAIYVGSFGGGGGGGSTIIESAGSSTNNSFTISQGSPALEHNNLVYVLEDGTYGVARADDILTSDVIGIVSAVNGSEYTITVSGIIVPNIILQPGFIYFLSDTVAGAATTTEPSTTGYVSKPVFTAINSVSAVFTNMRGIVIA